jgi:hypothetical protein
MILGAVHMSVTLDGISGRDTKPIGYKAEVGGTAVRYLLQDSLKSVLFNTCVAWKL